MLLLLSTLSLNGLIQVEAATTDGGKVSNTINWNYNDGTLTISGSGEMPNYKTVNYYYEGIVSDAPWGDYLSSITSVSISGAITNIGDCAFSDCPLLTTISMPSTIKVIGSNSFARCSKLEKVVFPNSLTEIGQSAFIGCSRIEEISIPDTVTSIKGGAFQACSNLKTVKLSSSLTSISSSLFQQCSRLNGVTIPSSVTEIGSTAFYNCSALTEMIIPQSVTRLYDEAFSNCSSITEMNIPESVTHLHSRAFQNCTSLKKITINNKSTSFFYDVFKNCNKVTVYGYTDSTTEKYCEENGYAFSALDADSSELDIKTFEIDKKSGQKIGTKITLSAKATGGSSPYKYLFYYKDADGNEKSISSYSNSNNTEFTLTTVGTFSFGVRVKDNTDKTIEKQLNNFQVLGFTGFAGGDGSKNNPYLITDVSMFLEINKNINASYKLANNIDFSSFERISEFNGTFDGAGHTINVSLSEKKGIFNNINKTGIVKNINVNIGKASDFLPTNFGSICLSNYGKLEKCSVIGSFYSSNYSYKLVSFGGLVSNNYGVIDRCRNSIKFTVSKNYVSSGFHFGGICGSNCDGIVKNCLVDGNMQLRFGTLPDAYFGSPNYRSFIGGICGTSTNDNIKNCAINTNLDFGYLSDFNGGYGFSYGIISGDEHCTYDDHLELAKAVDGISGCIVNEESSLYVQFQFCNYGPSTPEGYINVYTPVYRSETYKSTDMKNITTKSYEEITIWWNNILKEYEDQPDPSTFEFSISGKKYFILNKEGNLNVGFQSAVDGQVLSELKNIKWTNSNPDIATVSGLDTGVADTGNNKVSVMATVKALNVGITTIEGTSPDGRKASFTINVEPEIKTNSGKTINNETDLAVFTVALNKPNKSYLQSFMNGIKASYEFKDGLASFDVSSPTVSIGDDGLSATFNYHLSPQWGGNITFVAVSSNGQIVDCLVNSGIDKYPEAPWTFHNEWRFKNRAIDDLSLTNEDYNALILGQSEKSIAAIKEYTKSLGKVGICFGMSFSAINFKKEIIPLDYLGNGIEYLYDANFNSISQSIIGYYHILQKDDDIIELGKTWLNYSNQMKLSKISRMKPGLLVFDWDNYSHAVVIYGEENGNWTRNGHKYNKRIETYDCNYPENLDQSIREESYLYYNSETYEWEIPNYDGASSYATGYLRYAFDDDEHLNLHNLRLQRQGIKNIVRLKDDETYTIVASNGQRFIIGGNTDLNNNICYTYKDTGYNLDGGFSFINVELNPQYTYEIIPENGKLEDFSVLNNGYCSTVDTILLSSIEISDKNVIANDIKGEYEISITSDNSTSKYSTYNLNGYDNKKISLDLIDSGLSIEGDDLSDITITGKNQTDDESESISIADGEDSVQIINQNKTFDLSGNMVNGDVNLDGIVNIIDATTVQQYLAEFLDLSDIQKKVADTDGDGTITITDATVIQQYLAEYIDHFNQPSAIKLNTNAVTLNVSDTHSLLPTISPSDVTNKSVTWTSSDNDIATISNGTVTAKSPGTAKITAKTYNGKTAKCTVTVKQIEPSSVSLNKNTLSLNEGDSYQLTATVSPSNATNKSITWETNNPEVATVDSNGRVTAKKSGKTNIIAETTNGKRAECSITVNDSYINIYTEDDLYNIRRNLNGKFRLMTNIDTYGSPFSFGSQSQPFTGELDGNGFSITIKYDQGYAGSSMMTRGIFSYTENAYIHDLTVKGELVSSLSYYNGGMTVYCAGISACSKNSIFENCVNNATSNAVVSNPSGYTGSGYAYSGGIVAWSKSDRIIGCTNNGNVSAYGGTELRTDAIAGGIVAVSDGTEITRCNNNGYVYSQSATSSDQYWALAYSGGIIGSNYSCSLNNCNHNGTVEAICQPSVETKYQSWAAAGGIIAYGGSSVSYAGCTSNYNCKANGSNGALLANGKFYAR